MRNIQIKDFVTRIFNNRDRRINLANEIVNHFIKEGFSELEALEKCEEHIKKIKRAINKIITEHEKQAITPKYLFDKADDDILIRADLIVDIHKEKDTKQIIDFKEKVSEILKKISWDEFEKVCGFILKINNVQKYVVTRGSKDGGIDVFGWLTYQNSKRLFNEIEIRIVGQGKHRDNCGPVSNAAISEFVTDVNKLKKKQGFSSFTLPSEFIDSPYPLIPILITNGYYQRDAKSTAKEYGIILWNGDQICEDIAKNIDFTKFISDGTLDKEKIKTYLINE